MSRYKLRTGLILAIVAAFVVSLVVIACGGRGNTDGGEAVELASTHDRPFGDGFSNTSGRIIISINSQRMATGSTTGFAVQLLDSSGRPLEGVNVFCDTELGLAIIEPTNGFELTGSDGTMSGVLGADSPGSYAIECRAPNGFGLVASTIVVNTGDRPEGFSGFAGASGGTLGGGGRFIPDTEEVDEGGVRITLVQFTDVTDTSTSGPIDIIQGTCTSGTGVVTPEPFTFNDYILTVQNDTAESITVGTVRLDITPQFSGGGVSASTTTQPKTVEIPQSSTGQVDGLLTEFSSGASKLFTGSGVAVANGTYTVVITVTATSESGISLSSVDSVTLTFDNVDRC